MKILSKFPVLAAALSRPAIMFWTLPWLMVLLVAGTVAQKYVGLYSAQTMFFSSFVFWLGPLPLPGGYSAIGVIFICLLFKFINESRWSWQRAGIILTHFGALVLLAGGLLTALTSREGYMVIAEGAQSAVIEDYHARALTITKDGDEIFSLPFEKLAAGRILGIDAGLPFNVEILSAMANGAPGPRKNAEDKTLRGAALKVEMTPAPLALLDENNHGAVTVALRGTGPESDGHYLMTEIMPIYPQIDYKDHVYELRFGKQTTALPFSLALLDIEKDSYPGMDMARAYRSALTIKDQDTAWPALISMNNPLRYRGYTFYQSSYIQAPEGETTVLSVVWNAGRLFPYIASAIITLGLILHLLMSVRGRRAAAILCAVACLSHTPAQAATNDMTDFRMIPVLHEGRLKPLATFAQAQLRAFSGKADAHAAAWLAQVLFDPVGAAERPVFAVRNRDVLMLLRLPKQQGSLYSFSQLMRAMEPHDKNIQSLLQMPPDKREARQRALTELYQKTRDYMQLMRTFSLVLPLAVSPPESLLTTAEAKEFSGTLDYMALRKLEERATKRLKDIVRKRGDNPETYKDDERAVAIFAWQLQALAAGSEGNNLFRVIPVSWDHEERVAPWAVLQEGQGSPATAEQLAHWKKLGLAWLDDDEAAWQSTARVLAGTPTTHFRIEALYGAVNPFQWALALYVLATVVLAVYLMSGKLFSAAVTVLVAGGLVHALGLAARVYILARPPVGTLYESLLFVALICVIAGTWLCWQRRDGFSGLAATSAAMLLLAISLYFGAQSGDSLSMLVAVLNTNFWLATHVLIVTAGYGLSILAAMLAHAWLFEIKDRSGLFVTMHRMALAALLFTAVGTILGGIWADQSWGRFWGWDPKENGALLIVLWIVWLLHGRLAGQLKPPLYAALMAGLNIIVGLAWFGVNLLNVGLHSYGFTSGIAAALGLFCAAEISLITFLYVRRIRHA